MNAKDADSARPHRLSSSPPQLPEPPPLRIQVVTPADVDWIKRWSQIYIWLIALLPTGAAVMGALGLLAQHHVAVPALGYAETLAVLFTTKVTIDLLTRGRWYA